MSAITTQHAKYTKAATKWVKVRDCLEGEDQIHEKGEEYLPKLSKRQKTESYNAYRDRARFWNATKRTIAGWRGAVFRRPPTSIVPEVMKPLLLDINLQATPINDFAGQVLDEVLSLGRAGILVDHQESAKGRTYMLLFKAEEIKNWATVVEDGARKLALVVLGYCVNEMGEDGYGTEEVSEYRELRLVDGVYIQRVWREQGEGNKKTWKMIREVIPQVHGKALTEIPFVFIGAESLSPEIQQSPLYEIVTVNLHHYKRNADLCHGLHFAALPTPYSINEEKSEDQEPLELGAGVFQQFRGEGVTVAFLEHSGTGLGAVRQDMEDMKQEIASLGAAAITPPLRMAESAQALENKQNEQSAPLVKTVDVVSQGLTEALAWLVYWEGGAEEDAKLELNKAFANTRLSPQDIQALSAALQAGAITEEVFAYFLEMAETLPPDLDYQTYAAQLREAKAERRANMPKPAPGANETTDPNKVIDNKQSGPSNQQ
jgi:hypothetical protein